MNNWYRTGQGVCGQKNGPEQREQPETMAEEQDPAGHLYCVSSGSFTEVAGRGGVQSASAEKIASSRDPHSCSRLPAE